MTHALPDPPRRLPSAAEEAAELGTARLMSPPAHPTPSVAVREGAEVEPKALRVAQDAAVKRNLWPSQPGFPSTRTHWQTHLHVEAWVRNTTYAKHVWADVHVFGHDGALAASETIPLAYARPAGDGGDLFQLDRVVYEGATATPGSATPRPDVRLVQYRLYYQFDGRVVTDGELHQCVLRSDAVST
ncbi:hypothetical protein [Roseisolibacter agri]|uniref:Uncharacterized protein n=1 Tax=Roseisolibacter agri TaxID=2014610 RepID=A0AA37V2E1_9BACT|nr:hypothetical protein [Roseisolibacter agri]GLC27670.1 hypothetical protein rosag_41830 [Roseisolibacter agri]